MTHHPFFSGAAAEAKRDENRATYLETIDCHEINYMIRLLHQT
jgi:hypothetical protein